MGCALRLHMVLALYLCMIKKLIEIGAHKIGSKRQLGIFMGFNEAYAGQRINEIYNKGNITFRLFIKLLEAAEMEHYLSANIDAEHRKMEQKML